MNLDMKRILVMPVSVCAAVILLLSGCEMPSTEPSPESATTPEEPSPVESPPASEIEVELAFPNGAPPLNQEAEITCTVYARGRRVRDMEIRIDMPEALELVKGQLFWTGNVALGDKVEVIKAMVKAVKTGNWEITVHPYLDPEKNEGVGWGPGGFRRYISIAEDSAEWGIRPPWFKGPTPPLPVKRASDQFSNVTVDLSISHAPKLSEPAKLLVTILSPVDFPGLTAEIIFYQGAELLEGTKKQPIDLKAGVPVHFSATIVFRETGYRTVTADVCQQIDNVWHHSPQDTIYLKIGVNESIFEREPEKETPIEELPPPPAISMNGTAYPSQ